MLQTLRARTTAAAVIAVALVLTVAAITATWLHARQLTENLDRSLEHRSDDLAAIEPRPGVAGVILPNTNAEDRFAQIVGVDGQIAASTTNVSAAPLRVSIAADKERSFETRTDIPAEDDAYRVLQRRLASGAVLIIGENHDDLRDNVSALGWILGLSAAVVTLILGVVIWWLIGRTLRPVDAITAEVSAIGLDRLDRRVPTPGSDDEIDRLASTMNEMLGRLETAAVQQQEFVADASHELRTPLTRIRAMMEADPTNVDNEVLDEVVELQALVDDLLFLAHHDARATPPPLQMVDLDVIVEDEVRRARAAADVPIDAAGVSGAAVPGHPHQLARLVRNLLANAVDHAVEQVVVTLRELPNEVAVLTVDDDGAGIRAADRDHVFDRFVRLDDARSRRDGGTGLGLAIVREVVANHGGTVMVDDAELGGARFRVTIGAQTAAGSRSEPSPGQA